MRIGKENIHALKGRFRKAGRTSFSRLLARIAAVLLISLAATACSSHGSPPGAEAQAADTDGEDQGQEAGTDMEQAADAAGDTGAFPADMFSGNPVEWQGRTYRRNTYVKAILCIGVDRTGEAAETTHALSACADTVMLLVHDTARGSFKVLMIPRDTMTDIMITDLSGNELGKGLQHLTLAYSYGDGQAQSCEYMADAVSGLLKGLPIDHYAAVSRDVIAAANDMVGGVTVTVPTEGMEAANPAFVKGETITLKGSQATEFVHYRDVTRDNSALYRMDQHQEYIKGFFEAAKRTSRENPGIVEQLYGCMEDYMVTDMSKADILGLGADALTMEGFGDADIFTTPGYGIAGTSLYDEFYVKDEELVPVILELFYREA